MITMSSLPPVDVGDEVKIYSCRREQLGEGPVVIVDEGGIVLDEGNPRWYPWSAVGWLDLRDSGKAQQLLAEYRREHPDDASHPPRVSQEAADRYLDAMDK